MACLKMRTQLNLALCKFLPLHPLLSILQNDNPLEEATVAIHWGYFRKGVTSRQPAPPHTPFFLISPIFSHLSYTRNRLPLSAV